MKKPIIGVAPQMDPDIGLLRMDPHYFDALLACGALPVMLPLVSDEEDIARLADLYDGYLFPGGPDVLPELFGEDPLRANGNIVPARDALEIPLIRAVIERGKPLLGICRGCQMLNVALGGTLWQDLPSQKPDSIMHTQKSPYHACIHKVKVDEGTPLAEILGCDSLMTNSMHHQAVKDVAPGLQAVAHTADGVVEAICGTGKNFALGIQWHPEWLAANKEEAKKLFRAFVEASRG